MPIDRLRALLLLERASIDGSFDHLTKGPDGDLWQLLVNAKPTTHPTWIPAHKTLAEYHDRGLPAHIWRGNDQADKIAKAAVEHTRAPQLSYDLVVDATNEALSFYRGVAKVLGVYPHAREVWGKLPRACQAAGPFLRLV